MESQEYDQKTVSTRVNPPSVDVSRSPLLASLGPGNGSTKSAGGRVAPMSGPVTSPYVSWRCGSQLGEQALNPTAAEQVSARRKKKSRPCNSVQLLHRGRGVWPDVLSLYSPGHPRPFHCCREDCSRSRCGISEPAPAQLERERGTVGWKDPEVSRPHRLILSERKSLRKVKGLAHNHGEVSQKN